LNAETTRLTDVSYGLVFKYRSGAFARLPAVDFDYFEIGNLFEDNDCGDAHSRRVAPVVNESATVTLSGLRN